MIGRLRCRRPPIKPPWFPDHDGCTTAGHVVNVFDHERKVPVLQVLVGIFDTECVTALAETFREKRATRGNDFGLGVVAPRRGSIGLRVEGRLVEVSNGSYAVVNPDEHAVPQIRRPYDATSVSVFQPYLRECREAIGLPRVAGPFDFQRGARPMTPAIREALKGIQTLAGTPAGGEEERWLSFLLVGAVARLLASLWRDHPCGAKARGERLGYRRTLPPPLQRAAQFMAAHLAQPLTNGQVADEAGVSVQHLFELFQRQFGYTPQDYFRRLRVDQAKHLKMAIPRASWQAIAEQVGFTKASSLTRYL